MANKILKTLTLPNAQGEPVTYELHPEWDNIEGKPKDFGTPDLGSETIIGILPPEHGGTGNTNGYIQIGAKDSSTIGDGATAEGYDVIASGEYSHAEGKATIAASDYQHAQGKYNLSDDTDTYAHIVGNGDDENNRSNAHTLDWDGNAWYAGSITATKLILGPESYGTSLPTNGVEGQIFFLIGGSSGIATDDGNGVITLG